MVAPHVAAKSVLLRLAGASSDSMVLFGSTAVDAYIVNPLHRLSVRCGGLRDLDFMLGADDVTTPVALFAFQDALAVAWQPFVVKYSLPTMDVSIKMCASGLYVAHIGMYGAHLADVVLVPVSAMRQWTDRRTMTVVMDDGRFSVHVASHGELRHRLSCLLSGQRARDGLPCVDGVVSRQKAQATLEAMRLGGLHEQPVCLWMRSDHPIGFEDTASMPLQLSLCLETSSVWIAPVPVSVPVPRVDMQALQCIVDGALTSFAKVYKRKINDRLGRMTARLFTLTQKVSRLQSDRPVSARQRASELHRQLGKLQGHLVSLEERRRLAIEILTIHLHSIKGDAERMALLSTECGWRRCDLMSRMRCLRALVLEGTVPMDMFVKLDIKGIGKDDAARVCSLLSSLPQLWILYACSIASARVVAGSSSMDSESDRWEHFYDPSEDDEASAKKVEEVSLDGVCTFVASRMSFMKGDAFKAIHDNLDKINDSMQTGVIKVLEVLHNQSKTIVSTVSIAIQLLDELVPYSVDLLNDLLVATAIWKGRM